MGLNLVTQGSDNSESGPLLSAMESFGSGLEQGLTSLKTAVSSYNDSQAQEVLASFDSEFCTDASYTASSEKPLNFTGTRLAFFCAKQLSDLFLRVGTNLGALLARAKLLHSICYYVAQLLKISACCMICGSVFHRNQADCHSTNMLHVITGPSASLTFSWGNCTFNESQFLDSSEATKILNCTEPSIVYDKDPAIFTSKYKTGDSFTGKVRFVVSAIEWLWPCIMYHTGQLPQVMCEDILLNVCSALQNYLMCLYDMHL